MDPKQRAADAALTHVRSGMTVGLGTGSTAKFFIDALGAAIDRGDLRNIRGLPTSIASDEQARGLGIPIVTFDDVDHCDVTIDGADEVGPGLMLIKGLGGALLREKIVAQNSHKLIIIADASKVVPRLGVKGPLPVEIAPFSLPTSRRFAESLGCVATLRKAADGSTFETNNGNMILDCKFAGIDDAAKLNTALRSRAGILETGLFIGIAALALVADGNAVQVIER